jgi:hypothetical protein
MSRPRLVLRGFVSEVVEGGKGLVGYVPLAENAVDDLYGEAGGDQAAHDAGGLLLVGGLAEALPLQVLTGEGLFVGFGVALGDHLLNDAGGDSPLAKVLTNPALAELVVLAAKAGEGFGIGAVVELMLLLKPGDDSLDDPLPP